MLAITKDIVGGKLRNDAQGRALACLLRCARVAQSWASQAWYGRWAAISTIMTISRGGIGTHICLFLVICISVDFEGGILVICISIDFEGGIETHICLFLVVCIKFGFDDGDIFKHIVDEVVKGGSCAKPGLADPVRRAHESCLCQ